MTELTDLSETDDSNTSITTINIAEGCPPSNVNNGMRAILGLIRRAFKSSIFRIRDLTDQTRMLAFDLSGLTTATTRTVVIPDANGTMALTSDLPAGHLYGLTLSNNATDATNDIDVAAGEAASDNASHILMTYAGATGRQLDVAYGTGSGARFDTSISDGTWHVFLISNGTTVGVGLSKSLDPTGQANYPSGYTHYRRIGSILRASSAIVAFSQVGNEFLRAAVNLDVTASNPGTSAFSQVLAVPTGIKVVARVILGLSNIGTGVVATLYASSLDQTDQAPSVSAAPLAQIVNVINGPGGVGNAVAAADVRTNTSGQIRVRLGSSDGDVIVRVATIGWIDTRGQ